MYTLKYYLNLYLEHRVQNFQSYQEATIQIDCPKRCAIRSVYYVSCFVTFTETRRTNGRN